MLFRRIHDPSPTLPGWEVGHRIFRQTSLQLLELMHKCGARRGRACVSGAVTTRDTFWPVFVNTVGCGVELTGAVILDVTVFLAT